jgi:peptidoglycan/xylan/chitin deacetylase (PgdA/CDA1 family)
VALTFDDGPDPELTPRVLDLLDAAGQRATFFCIGKQAEVHPDIVLSIRNRGHGIENHSYSHRYGFALRGAKAMARELTLAQDVIESISGYRPKFFRPPAGIQSVWLRSVLIETRLSLVSWTRRGFDTVSSDGQRVTSRLIGKGLTAGEILLLHDRVPLVIDVLPRLLEHMKQRDLKSIALHEVD